MASFPPTRPALQPVPGDGPTVARPSVTTSSDVVSSGSIGIVAADWSQVDSGTGCEVPISPPSSSDVDLST